MYRCSVCNENVEVHEDGSASRSCGHDDAGITADMSATVYAIGSMMGDDPPDDQESA